MNQTLKYVALYLAIVIAFLTWAAFCYLQPQTVPVSSLIDTIKTFLTAAGSAALALYRSDPPPPPPPGAQ